MADGLFYVDMREPFIGADLTSVTLATTALPLYTPSNYPSIGSQYFARIGKKARIKMFGRITTGATPGNGQWVIYWGNGTATNGTILASSATFALTASQTSLSWWFECSVYARALGSTGALMCTGEASFNPSVVASTLQPIMIPASAPAQVTVDLTQNYIVSVQFLRSGSTAETMQVHDLDVEAMN